MECGDDGCDGSCGECDEGGVCREGTCSYLPNWTILSYMAIDNNLEYWMGTNLAEMAAVGSSDNKELAISQIDLSKVPAVEEALSEFVYALSDGLPGRIGEIMIARYQAEQFAVTPYDFMSNHLIDLGDFASHVLDAEDEFAVEVGALLDAIHAAVPRMLSGPEHANATGLSIYFPPYFTSKFLGYTEAADMAKINYDAYCSYDPPEVWSLFLADWLESVTLEHVGPLFACPEEQDEAFCYQHSAFYEEDESAVTVNRSLLEGTGADDVFSSALFGYLDYSSMTLDVYAALAGSVTAESGLVEGSFDRRRLVMHQGSTESPAYWSEHQAGGTRHITVPVFYREKGVAKSILARFERSIDQDTGDVISSTLVVDTEEGEEEVLVPAPESTIHPVKKYVDISFGFTRWDKLSTQFDAEAAIDFLFEELPPCNTFFLGVYVEDSLGRNDIGALGQICNGGAGPQHDLSLTVNGVGDWDDGAGDEPDFAIKVFVDAELVHESEVAPNAAEVVFETTLDYQFFSSVALELWEFDDAAGELVATFELGPVLFGANGNCMAEEEFEETDIGGDPSKTVTLTAAATKCVDLGR